jgi:hypothetical protein
MSHLAFRNISLCGAITVLPQDQRLLFIFSLILFLHKHYFNGYFPVTSEYAAFLNGLILFSV